MIDIDLRLGRWQDALADVEMVDCLIVDAPYVRADGHRKDYGYERTSIDYSHMTPDDVRAFVDAWAPRVRGWMVSLTDDVLFPVWRDAMREAGRTVFQDVVALIPGMTVRLCGDGPSSWTIHCAVSRPSSKEFARWGTLPGGYTGQPETQEIAGGKPLWLMRAIVRDYSRPGDLVCDPCAGGATTLLAAAIERRHAIGSEMDPTTHAKAQARLARGYTPSMFGGAKVRPREGELLLTTLLPSPSSAPPAGAAEDEHDGERRTTTPRRHGGQDGPH